MMKNLTEVLAKLLENSEDMIVYVLTFNIASKETNQALFEKPNVF